MLAIQTRFLGPTNTHSPRIVAEVTESRPVRRYYFAWIDSAGVEQNHRLAAAALIHQLGWTAENGYGRWIVGATVKGYAFVNDGTRTNDALEGV